MNYSDYQVGNNVRVKGHEQIFRIETIDTDKKIVSFTKFPDLQTDWYSHDEIENILLSTAVIRKLGFAILEEDTYGYRLPVSTKLEYLGVSHHLYIRELGDKYSVGLYTIDNDALTLQHPPLGNFKFVHELQNFYHNYIQNDFHPETFEL